MHPGEVVAPWPSSAGASSPAICYPPTTVAPDQPQPSLAQSHPSSWVNRWIKTTCGRAKYADLAQRPGVLARLRLAWFVLIAALRDRPLPPPPEQP